MKNITLQTAIMLTVNELLKTGSFSAYEVTQVIRGRVDTDYEISDCDYDGGIERTLIPHSLVRVILNELFDNELFEASKAYETDGFNTWIVFNALKVANDTQPQTPVVTNAPATDHCLNKINDYLKNNGPATIKQIQSRLKIKGLTCNDIARLLAVGRTNNLSTVVSKIVVNPV